jgi:hypothetical protein
MTGHLRVSGMRLSPATIFPPLVPTPGNKDTVFLSGEFYSFFYKNFSILFLLFDEKSATLKKGVSDYKISNYYKKPWFSREKKFHPVFTKKYFFYFFSYFLAFLLSYTLLF